jgi:hypothetical protein
VWRNAPGSSSHSNGRKRSRTINKS